MYFNTWPSTNLIFPLDIPPATTLTDCPSAAGENVRQWMRSVHSMRAIIRPLTVYNTRQLPGPTHHTRFTNVAILYNTKWLMAVLLCSVSNAVTIIQLTVKPESTSVVLLIGWLGDMKGIQPVKISLQGELFIGNLARARGVLEKCHTNDSRDYKTGHVGPKQHFWF